ncbi:MAG: energy-coupling factor ABC transporter permease [Bryobacteraceae bacterium]|nr:energy-coupling factor ABC transporter permease [Bryobacteraceae bacterium]MDW8376554.1 energy-coupling factor ABC transporter permease [Bryobacterales bacterium]
MHIADGIVPNLWCGAAHGVCWTALYWLGRRLETGEVVRLGMLASASFLISLVHFPFAGTSVHLGLYGLIGILAGRRAFPVIFAALLFQTLLFQHGGLVSLGLNAVNMGAGALLAGLLWRAACGPEQLRAFLCGFLGVFIPALLIALEFFLTGYGKGFFFLAALYLGAAILEGLLTVPAVAFLRSARPALLEQPF